MSLDGTGELITKNIQSAGSSGSNNVAIFAPLRFLAYSFGLGLIEHAKFPKLKLSSVSFRFYPYVLLTSTVFLLLTLIVYSYWSRLLNPYTRLMRHFALSMMLAFILLSINQLVAFGDISSIVCAANGLFYFSGYKLGPSTLVVQMVRQICLKYLVTCY